MLFFRVLRIRSEPIKFSINSYHISHGNALIKYDIWAEFIKKIFFKCIAMKLPHESAFPAAHSPAFIGLSFYGQA